MDNQYPHVDSWYDAGLLETDILEFWNTNHIFEKLRTQNRNGTPWSFIDGPITANNKMGIHHAWGRSLKDAFQRYYAMNGRKQRHQNGFDCQGLWVEVEVEKELGFSTKRDIESYGIGPFVDSCKRRVEKFASIITKQSQRLGYWMDWENSYYTMSDENNYTIWSFLKKCHERDLIYRGHDVMPWCPRCGTGLSQHEMSEGYHDATHQTVYVALPIRGRDNEFLAVWTTTPWTLPANVAVAVHPDITYARFSNGERTYYVCVERLDAIKRIGANGSSFTIDKRMTGAELISMDLRYDAPYDHLPGTSTSASAHRIIPWTEVTTDVGTGLVHIAPGCGEEDYALGREHNLPVLAPLDESGHFLDDYGFLSGLTAGEAGEDIVTDLRKRSLLIGAEPYTHSYPHCWRCDHELVYRLVDEWFIAMDPWRAEIMNVVKEIDWVPAYGKELELDWLTNMHDWMISKKRYWGLALPIWTSDDGTWFDVIGSRSELETRSISGWATFSGNSPHRPWIDAVKLEGPDERVLSRIPDVGNPWLDAGIVPYSTTGYASDRDYWRRWFPADLVLESFPGQFRNWFYSLLAMSTMMEGKPPYKHLLGHSQVRDEYGREMHKSTGNAIWFDDAVEQSGADVLRWLFYSSDIRNNIDFNFETAKKIRGKFFNTLWNSQAFFVNYARIAAFAPLEVVPEIASLPLLDQWILSRLSQLVKVVRRSFESHAIRKAVLEIEAFVESLSNWYIRLSRRRFWRGDTGDEQTAFSTLYRCLETLCRLIAPLVPMIADRIYKNVTACATDASESVHLRSFPRTEDYPLDSEALHAMEFAEEITNAALRARKKAGLRTRQPLATLTISAPEQRKGDSHKAIEELLISEINVKTICFAGADEAKPSTTSYTLNMGMIGPLFGPRTREVVTAFNDAKHVIPNLIDLESGVISLNVKESLDEDSAEILVEIPVEALIAKEEIPDHLAIGEIENGWIALDTRIDRNLALEGIARDVVRHVQILRKEAGFAIEDRIEIVFATQDENLLSAIEMFRDFLASELLANTVTISLAGNSTARDGHQSTVHIAGHELRVAIWRASV